MTRPKPGENRSVEGECRDCRQAHPKCWGHNRRGKPCGLHPSPDQTVCGRHGGDSPQARAGVLERRAEAEARAALRRAWAEGADTSVADPLSELARLAGEVVAFKDYLRGQVEGLDGVLTYWTERTFETEDTIRTEAVENMRATVAAYERAQERAAKVLANIVKLDLAGRLLALRTSQAAAFEGAIREGLRDVDMAHELRQAAEAAISDRLVELSATPAPRRELSA